MRLWRRCSSARPHRLSHYAKSSCQGTYEARRLLYLSELSRYAIAAHIEHYARIVGHAVPRALHRSRQQCELAEPAQGPGREAASRGVVQRLERHVGPAGRGAGRQMRAPDEYLARQNQCLPDLRQACRDLDTIHLDVARLYLVAAATALQTAIAGQIALT